jgi:hypothetical protein
MRKGEDVKIRKYEGEKMGKGEDLKINKKILI